MQDRPTFLLPIDATDAEIEHALESAHIPTLIAALAHLTDDQSLLAEAGTLRFAFFGDGQGGLDPEVQRRVRQAALDVLRRCREGMLPIPHSISPARVRELMSFIAGQPIPDRYLPLLLEELALEGDDPRAMRDLETLPREAREQFHVVIVGAGMSGLAAAVRLRQAGIPFTLIEKNPDVGGTWFDNTYPGCRVDTPNHLYSYSFEPNHDWPQHYSTQPVLLEYFKRVADRHDLRRSIRFETSVKSATWDETDRTWRVRISDASGAEQELVAQAVITAVGQLNQPRYPAIAGRERFQGPSFHSARWNHACDLEGKRVAVIGTGASAFQFVPEIADRTRELVVFQRSAPWLGPTANYHEDVPEGMKWLLQHVPFYERWYRFWLFWMMTDGILPAVRGEAEWNGSDVAVSELNDALRKMLTAHIESQIPRDTELFRSAVPDYPPGGKRMLRDNGIWLRTLQRDDVVLVTSPIVEITETGIVTADGRHHEVDVVIYGTGFKASEFLQPMQVTGRGGLDLNDHWGGDARAYLGISIPHFPNFFMMYGPNTNIVVNGSIVFFSECETRYILRCIEHLIREPHRAMMVKSDVHDAFNRAVDAENARMAWGWRGVESWYKNAKGRVSQNWPFSLVAFWEATQTPDPAEYEWF